MADSFMVFFRPGECDLDAAERALKGYRFSVVRSGLALVAQQKGKPEFRISLSSGCAVRQEAEEIGADTPYAEAMRECGSRFKVVFDDLDAVLDECNSLMEAEVALQEASQGYLFLSWNGNLSEPWRE